MKKFNLFLLLSSVVAILGCSKEFDKKEAVPEILKTIDVVINADVQETISDDSKTVVDGTTIKWSSSGEKLKVYEVASNAGVISVADITSGFGSSTDSYATMSFPVSLDEKTADNFTYYASYPSSAWVSNSSTIVQANIETKKSQTPTATSFDPSTDLLISKGIDNGDAQPTELNMQFARVIAIGKMTITNLPVDEPVNKVVFSANNGSALVLSGRTTYDLAAAEPVSSYGDIVSNTEVEINTAGLGLSAKESMDIWFTCYPFELSEGDTFKVEVYTNTFTCTRTVTIPAARELNFIAGKASRFSVDMTSSVKEKAQAWTKYTGVFSAGDYIIVYGGQAMSAGVSSNRLTYTAVTPVDDVIYTNKEDIVWTAAASSTYWTLYNAGESKYAASTGAASKAQLLADGSDDMSLWTVSGTDTYEFVNKKNTANGVNANLRYNSGYGFACYASGTGGALSLYKKDTRTDLDAPASVSAALNGSDNTVIDVTFSPVANAGTYTIVAKPTVGADVVKEGVSSSPATITVTDGLAYATEYTISVFAVPSDPSAYRNSAPATAAGTVTTGSLPNANSGDVLWKEDFESFSNGSQPATGSTILYGGGYATYTYSGTSNTKIYTSGALGSVEILIDKSSRGETWTVSGIPSAGWTEFSLSYSANQSLTIAHSGVTVTNVSNDGTRWTKKIELTGTPETFSLTFSMSTDSNCRLDDITLKAGAPVPGIIVATNAASSTTSAEGTTATLNGEITLVNGAENSSVTEAGFYYKLTSAGSYTKVTCDPAPTSTTSFSFDLTGLTTDSEYTYYAYAKYNGGSEVNGEAVTFIPTQTGGGGGKTNQVLFHETFGNNTGSARAWSDSYSVKTGVTAVYSGITGYTVSNVKQGKNTTGSSGSGLNQSAQGTDAYIIIGPLAVSSAENMVVTYQWKAASVTKTYSTSLYYATSSGGVYTEVSGTGAGATTFVERTYNLPAAAQVNTLYLKIVWNTSNTQAIIDEVNLQGDY